jgi:divalent metal cation (Fe/Co/Zn/Cd) transporter
MAERTAADIRARRRTALLSVVAAALLVAIKPVTGLLTGALGLNLLGLAVAVAVGLVDRPHGDIAALAVVVLLVVAARRLAAQPADVLIDRADEDAQRGVRTALGRFDDPEVRHLGVRQGAAHGRRPRWPRRSCGSERARR